MLPLLALILATQQQPPKATTAVRDSTPADSIDRDRPRRLPVTAEVLATAFHDARARNLFVRARSARLAQDSALVSYDAQVRERISIFAAIRSAGRERLVFRRESASRVQWKRGVGAQVEVTGHRVSAPVLGMPKLEREAALEEATDADASPVPYFPGTETLWLGGGAAKSEVDERALINPLGFGAEAYYTYRTGDSVSFRLPQGRVIQLRELEVRPRQPKWNFAVGSLWFDTESGQLVRAAYRLAAPAQAAVNVSNDDDTTAKGSKIASFLLTQLVSPNTAQISAVVVEYGLFQGRFWLPRAQSLEGSMQAFFARIPVKIENAFAYTSVNADVDIAEIVVDTARQRREEYPYRAPPGLSPAERRKWRDSVNADFRAKSKAREDSTKAGMKVGSMRQCDSSAVRVVTQSRYGDANVFVRVIAPCDVDKLIKSPDLPASAYDPGEGIWDLGDTKALIAEALPLAAQAPLFAMLPRPRIQVGPSMMRYNRVEGFSHGIRVDQQLGGGYSAGATGRYGFADHLGSWEFSLARSNLSTTARVNGYNRLVAANDWGSPLSFGASFGALLFGRDEGFYYRASGAELLWTSERGVRLNWRAFVEKQRPAEQNTTGALGPAFRPNIGAASGTFTGAEVRFLHEHGLDPRGLRTFTDLRLEGAGGDSTYGRAALDFTVSRGLAARLDASLTLAGGTSLGGLPVQRRWFLGGTNTIRGQRPDTAISGNAFWMSRLEFGRPLPGVRAALFGDLGWTGDRSKLGQVGRPLSGVGVGLSGLDGLIRLDLARGLYPEKRFQVNFYLDARF